MVLYISVNSYSTYSDWSHFCLEVPRPDIWNKRRLVDGCDKRFCNMGCICDSLNSVKPPLAHCNHSECMCHDVCVYKSSLRRYVSSSSTECDTCRESSDFDLLLIEQFLPKQWPLLKKELALQKEIIYQLQHQLNSKQLEVNKLRNQLVKNGTECWKHLCWIVFIILFVNEKLS